MKDKIPPIVKNRDTLLSHGNIELRRAALDIAEAGIRGADPGLGTHKIVRREGDVLRISDRRIDLRSSGKIYVVGAGKGSFPIAEALESILGDHIEGGAVVVKSGEKRRLRRIGIIEGGHPIPDENSISGAEKMIGIAEKAGPGDLVFIAVTGGASALATLPPEGISLSEVQKVNDLLLKSGAPIRHMNTIRKHLCLLKGGRLVSRIDPAEAFTLTLDTRPKGMPWPDVSLPDPTTFQDALDILEFYSLLESVPGNVLAYLRKGTLHPELETLKSLDGIRSSIFSVGDPIGAVTSAAAKAESLGFAPHVMGVNLYGESAQIGVCLAGITNEILLRDRPFRPPCALISSGETTVAVGNKRGVGGPNQEFILGFINELDDTKRVSALAVDTDGTDGPTEIAGGIVDGMTTDRAKALKIDLSRHVKDHDSSTALNALEDAVITGHTGTNVKNLRIILVER